MNREAPRARLVCSMCPWLRGMPIGSGFRCYWDEHVVTPPQENGCGNTAGDSPYSIIINQSALETVFSEWLGI